MNEPITEYLVSVLKSPSAGLLFPSALSNGQRDVLDMIFNSSQVKFCNWLSIARDRYSPYLRSVQAAVCLAPRHVTLFAIRDCAVELLTQYKADSHLDFVPGAIKTLASILQQPREDVARSCEELEDARDYAEKETQSRHQRVFESKGFTTFDETFEIDHLVNTLSLAIISLRLTLTRDKEAFDARARTAIEVFLAANRISQQEHGAQTICQRVSRYLRRQ